MVLLGTLVNGLAIVLGTVLGKLFHRIPDKIKTTVMHGIGLSVTVLGIQMGFKSQQFLIVIFSLVLGGVLGEIWRLEDRLESVGHWLEKKMGSKEQGSIAKGFVTATLIFLIGAMAIIGSLDSGLRNDHSVLFTKSIIDGFTSVVLASTLGVGVVFSAIPVVLYQGTIALLATQISNWVPQELLNAFIAEMTGTGGVMIVAIGLNILGIIKIRAANLLPSIIVTACLVPLIYYFG